MAGTEINLNWTANSTSPYSDQSYQNGDRPAGLTAPANFTATGADTVANLSWSSVTGATDYEVRVAAGAWVSTSNATTYQFTSLTNGQQYAFDVRATNGAENGPISSSVATPTTSVALYFDDMAAYTVGAVFTGFTRTTISAEQAFTQGKSAKVVLDTGQAPVACGGNPFFGGHVTLPDVVPQGNTIWYNARIYIPSTMTWGFTFGQSDGAEAATCGHDYDGSGNLKFLVMAPDTGFGRVYVQPPMGRRVIAQPVGPLYVNSDTGIYGDMNAGMIPKDAWVDLQMKTYVHSVSGTIECWINGTYMGIASGPTLANATYAIDDVGIGDYWNGVPWTDGGADRDYFYLDTIEVFSDIAGYGAPSGRDAGGRVYIASEV